MRLDPSSSEAFIITVWKITEACKCVPLGAFSAHSAVDHLHNCSCRGGGEPLLLKRLSVMSEPVDVVVVVASAATAAAVVDDYGDGADDVLMLTITTIEMTMYVHDGEDGDRGDDSNDEDDDAFAADDDPTAADDGDGGDGGDGNSDGVVDVDDDDDDHDN